MVIGILGLSPIVLYNFLWMPISNFLRSFVEPNIITNIILPFIAAALGLSIAAVVCGSIDLNKIKKRLYSNKGKGFDIAGIVMGGVIILFAMIFALGEIIVPH